MAPTTQVGHGSASMSVNPVAADERSRPRLRPASGVRKLPAGTEIKSAKRLGDWILEEQIGSGSYGVVWSAYHAMYPNQKVAVKIVDLRLLKKPSEREALKREVVLHSKLDHKNIVGLYEIWESDYEIGFVLELVEGGSLFDFLTSPESNDHALHPLARRFKVHRDETRVQVLFWQMLNALDYLHCNWIVHRDVKLENFLISKDCTTVKLCDFGLSSTFSPDSLMRSTCGSPLYIPPEVLMGVAYDPTKADLWSLGITLFAIIFRKMPFLDNRNQLVLEYCLRGAKNLPPALAKRITPQAHEVLCMLLTPDPAERATLETLFAHPWVQAGKELYEQEQMELHPPLPILSGKVSVAPPSGAANPPVPGFKLQRRRKSFLFLKPYFPSAAAAPATATDHYPAVAAAPAPGAPSPVGPSPQHQQAAYATGVANQDAAPLTPRGEKLAEELEAMKPSFFSRMLFKPRRKNSI